ncbi:MAG: hypothetical protein ACLR1T_01535 [Evtepia gabavorous]
MATSRTKNDVETAQRELEGVIQEITQEMEAIFRREFARIQAAFSQTFADLFGGGQGTLSLEDETDVLRCGIEIRAQPRARPCGPSAFSLEESGPWWPSPCTLPF